MAKHLGDKSPMRVVAIASQKGGSGKTTVAVHLAVAALRAGERVAILDTDPQGSAIAWSQARTAEEPTVVAVEAPDVAAALEEARRDGYTVAIVDTAPRAAPIAATIMRAATFVLIPVRPSAFDLAALERSVAIVTAAGVAGAIVLNACPPRAPEILEAREFCSAQSLPLADVMLGDRRAFARAVASGRAVEEFAPRSPAALEIRALWAYIAKRSRP